VPLLEVNDLHLTVPTASGPVAALRGVSFALERGQTLGLIGESGCGKSITALAIMGLLPEGAHATGSIRLAGRELIGLDEAAWCGLRGQRLAMIFQEPMTALNPLMTIGRQVAEPLQLHRGLTGAAARAEALRLLERVRIAKPAQRLGAHPHELSGGQRQRVMIAMALACGPDVLLADEPTTALDATTQGEVLDLLAEVGREDGMAMVLISHDLALMAERAGRLLVMYAGSVVESGSAEAVLDHPAHPYTQGLQAARPRLGMGRLPRQVPGAAPAWRLPTIPGRVPSLADLPAGCPYAERCPRVTDACHAALPAAVTLSPGHMARCLHVQR
jgi:peptide/nickel transport system ATP-binding protein